LKNLIKSGREKKGLLIREVANLIGVDAALVSKFESGTRKPTRLQIHKLAQILDLDADELMVAWLKEKILFEVGTDDLALRAMIAAEEEIKYQKTERQKTISKGLKKLLLEIDKKKKALTKYREFDSFRIAQALELEYTF